MEQVTFVLGFVIELQQYAKDYSLPICGINDRGDTVWSDITYWRQSYLCGPKTRCPMGFGSVVDGKFMRFDCERISLDVP